MRRAHCVHVVYLTGGGAPAVEVAAIPARRARLCERGARGVRRVLPPEDGVWTIGARMQRLVPWHRIRNDGQFFGCAGTGAIASGRGRWHCLPASRQTARALRRRRLRHCGIGCRDCLGHRHRLDRGLVRLGPLRDLGRGLDAIAKRAERAAGRERRAQHSDEPEPSQPLSKRASKRAARANTAGKPAGKRAGERDRIDRWHGAFPC